MKTVKNVGELRKLALATGATARVGGQVVNAGGERMALRRPEPAPQAPTQPPPSPPQTSPNDVSLIADAMRGQGEAMAASLAAALGGVQFNPPPAAEAFAGWHVSVKYDSDGRITDVFAQPMDQ